MGTGCGCDQILVTTRPIRRRVMRWCFFGDASWPVSSLAEYCEVDLREAIDLLKAEFEVRFPVEGGK